jgi:hypothetical protein
MAAAIAYGRCEVAIQAIAAAGGVFFVPGLTAGLQP